MSLLLPVLYADTPKKKVFRFNPGAQEKIFPPKHPYYKAPEQVQQILEKIVEKSAAAIEREKYLKEMEPLIEKKVLKEADGENINIGFTRRGNKHLYNDTFERAKEFSKEDLKIIDKIFEQAIFVKSAKIDKKRKDKIKKFYYFKDKDKKLYYNVGEEIKKGKVHRYLYSITKK